jgi:hypothetical protein
VSHEGRLLRKSGSWRRTCDAPLVPVPPCLQSGARVRDAGEQGRSVLSLQTQQLPAIAHPNMENEQVEEATKRRRGCADVSHEGRLLRKSGSWRVRDAGEQGRSVLSLQTQQLPAIAHPLQANRRLNFCLARSTSGGSRTAGRGRTGGGGGSCRADVGGVAFKQTDA